MKNKYENYEHQECHNVNFSTLIRRFFVFSLIFSITFQSFGSLAFAAENLPQQDDNLIITQTQTFVPQSVLEIKSADSSADFIWQNSQNLKTENVPSSTLAQLIWSGVSATSSAEILNPEPEKNSTTTATSTLESLVPLVDPSPEASTTVSTTSDVQIFSSQAELADLTPENLVPDLNQVPSSTPEILNEILTPIEATSSPTSTLETLVPEVVLATTTTSSPPEITSPKNLTAPILESGNFTLATSTGESIPGEQLKEINLNFQMQAQAIAGAKINLEYSVAGTEWQTLQVLDLSNASGNLEEQKIPLPKNLENSVSELSFRIVYGLPLGTQPTENLVSFGGLNLEKIYALNFDSENIDLALANISKKFLQPEQFLHIDASGKFSQSSLPGSLSDPITVSSSQDNSTQPFQMYLIGAASLAQGERNGNKISYDNALPHTRVEYNITDNGLKENIVLKETGHANKFRYALNLENYDAKVTGTRQVDIFAKGHAGDAMYRKFSLLAPVMTDANGTTSQGLEFKLNKNILTLSIDKQWLKTATYPVVVDPTISVTVLNVYSHPTQGTNWNVDFTTSGTSDLTISQADQSTVGDTSFSSMSCGSQNISPDIISTSTVTFLNWSCADIGHSAYYVNLTGKHHLIFSFGGQTADAFNSAKSWTGGAGTSNWEDGANWSPAGIPGASDDIVINTATTVNLNGASSISSLTLGISGGGTASVLNFNYDAIATSPLTMSGSLLVYGSAIIQHTVASSTGAIVGKINLNVGGNASITGSINADAAGYQGGQGPGTGAQNVNAGGAGYGGVGGTGNNSSGQGGTGGASYGSSTAPTALGSGGGNAYCNPGGTGGGAIQLTAIGTTTISGTLSVNGGNGTSSCWYGGGGSGGSIYITTGVLAGNGSLQAKGGAGYATAGSGAGGRIAVYYATDNSTVSYQQYGGSSSGLNGGSGTVVKKAAASSTADLILDNNNQGGSSDGSFGRTTIGAEIYNSITIQNSASLYLTASSATTTTLTISNNGHYDAKPQTSLNSSSTTWTGGIITDSGGSFSPINQNQDLTIATTSKITLNAFNATRTYNNLTINGTYTQTPNTNATTGSTSLYKINLIANNNLTIGPSGVINADYAGYVGGVGPGTGAQNVNAGGAGYGGVGGTGNNSSGQGGTGGASYGSSTAPTALGSGGGNAYCNPGGTGGGAIQLTAIGTTTISGTLSVNGGNGTSSCWYGGGGSGGSIYITTGVLAGNGSLQAKGGAGYATAGSGAGGRIAVYYATDNSTVSYQQYGGSSSGLNGGSGTVVKKAAASSTADLILDNNNQGGSSDGSFGRTTIGAEIYNSITIQNSASLYLTASSATTTTLTISNNGHYDAKPQTSLNSSSTTWTGGIITDSGGSFSPINQNQDLTIATTSKITLNAFNATRTYNNLTINGTYTQTPNTNATTGSTSLYKINLIANNNLTIGPSGVINADYAGYVGGVGPGAGGSSGSTPGGGGAGYGAVGGDAGATGGAGGVAYGSSTAPTDLGSGGGNGGCTGGGTGGGAIQLTATGTTTILGTLTANGYFGAGGCSPGGGGSGGSIYITTGVLAGNGSLQVKGGAGYVYGSSGGGAGGRMAIYTAANLATITRDLSFGTSNGATQAGVGSTYPPDVAGVSTEPVTNNITGTSVTGNGTILSFGYYPITQYGFVWGTTLNPYIPNTNMAVGTLNGTFYASKQNQGAITYAFDNNSGTLWGSSEGAPYDLEYDFASTTVVNKYVVVSSPYTGDTPKDWQFQAWDGVSWASLQSVSSQTGWGSGEARAFTFVNTTAYPKYRLYITANNGGGWTRVADLQMLVTTGNVSAKGATSTLGSFSDSITGLSPYTAYHVRAYTTTSGGISYGDNASFNTGPVNGAPYAPSSLGPNAFVTNSWSTSTAPTLNFNLSDPDPGDTDQYRIIIDNDSNFSSPLVDYISALQAQGVASFTVGQNAGSGSYATGSAGQRLPDGSSYYWEVQAIDSTSASSAFTVANSGSIAFKLDTTKPTAGTISFGTVSENLIAVNSSGASDAGSGIASYTFLNQTNSATTGAIGSTHWDNSGLTPNTRYTYLITVTDNVGFIATTATSSQLTLANVPSAPTSTVMSATSVLMSWNNNANPPGTEYYAENSTSAYNSGWVTATSTLFTGLTCGTSYSFHVRARNADGVTTSYGSLVSPSASPCNSNPNSPSSLGYSNYVNGGWTNNNTPNLAFTLTDPDASDTVKYRVEISTTSNFSGLVVDYTSALQAQGSTAFTVGQSAGSGTYAVGSVGQTLVDSSAGYYWRVMSMDNNAASSAWVTANSGSMAFKIDTVPPTAGVLSLVSTTTDAVTLSFTGGSDADSGLNGSPYNFYNTTNWSGSNYTSATSWTNTGLTAGTYSYKIRVTDIAGNYTEVSLPGSVTVSGNGGGGGGGDPWSGSVTSGFSVFVNQNDSITNTQNVTLQLTGQPGTTQMLVSNLSNFSGAVKEAYSTTKTWDLCAGLGGCYVGPHTVYAKFYNVSDQSSGTVSDSITYQILGSLVPGWLSVFAVSTSTVVVNINESADAPYGLKASPYNYYNRSNGDVSGTSSIGSWIDIGLVGNTQYTFYALVTNNNGDTGYTEDVSAFTLANPPANLVATSVTASSISFNWDANNNSTTTEYSVLNQTTGVSASWGSATSTIISGLSCNSSYTFKVKARNGNAVETEYSNSVTQQTSACPIVTPPGGGGGGGIVINPEPLPIILVAVCPSPVANSFTECIYSDKNLSTLATTSIVSEINYNNIPYGELTGGSFSAAWQGFFNFTSGTFEFKTTTDSGVRLYIDNKLIIDQWENGKQTSFKSKTISLNNGGHLVRMEYSHSSGQAVAKLTWESVESIIHPKPITPKPVVRDIEGSLYFVDVTASSTLVGINFSSNLSQTEILQSSTIKNVTTGAVKKYALGNTMLFSGLLPNTTYTFKASVVLNDGTKVLIPDSSLTTLSKPVVVIPPRVLPPVPPAVTPPPAPPVVTPPPKPIVITPPETIVNPLPIIIKKVGDVITNSGHGFARFSNVAVQTLAALPQEQNKMQVSAGVSAVAVAPTVLAMQYSVASYGFLLNVGSISDIWFSLLRYLYMLLTLAGLRKRRRPWGTVYDSKNKQPLDPVMVELYSAETGKKVQDAITDLWGRFGFLDKPGKYYIVAKKSNYTFPSKLITANIDGLFANLNHGEVFSLTPGSLVTPNIPMDQEAFDWNQEDKKRIVKVNPKLELFVQNVLGLLFWSGFALVILSAIAKTTALGIFFAAIYLVLAILRKFIPHARLWGRITKQGQPMSDVILELSHPQLPGVRLGKAMADGNGRFFLKTRPGEYLLKIFHFENGQSQLLKSQTIKVGKEDVVNEKIDLE